MSDKILFDVFIYKNELNSRDCCNSDLECCNLQKDCIKIFKFNDNPDDFRYVCQISADFYQEDKYIRTDLIQVIFNVEKDNWNIEGYKPNENSFGEKDTKEFGVPSKHSIVDFFGNK